MSTRRLQSSIPGAAEGGSALLFTLARHAHAGERKLWPFSELDRPLSVRGHQQAQGLSQALAGAPVRLLVSSPYRRCRQTLAPLAAQTGLAVQISDLLGPDAKPAALEAYLRDPALDGAVLCTHGETLDALLRRWHRHGRVALPQPRPTKFAKDTTAKGGAWVVEDAGNVPTAHYLRPVRVIDVTSKNALRVVGS